MDRQCARGRSLAGTGVDTELLEFGAGVEANTRFWRAEFAWLLAHPAVAAVAPADAQPLTLRAMAGEHAMRFPLVSGDADWLRQRSMAVVARRLAAHLAAGSRVALDVSALARGEAAADLRREQMRLVAAGLREALPQSLSRYGVTAAGLVLSLTADHPGLGALLGLRECATLGRPPVIVRIPDRVMLALGSARAHPPVGGPCDSLRLWRAITAVAHREPGVRLVLEHTTRPACALAWGERGDAVLPLSQFEVRAETAWLALRIRLDLLDLGSVRAGLNELRRLLRAGLRLADNLVEQLDWPSPELAQDALVNRRLAVHVTGIGDLIDRWELDPAAFRSVKFAARWLAMVRRLMVRESNALARERGPFPGLELRDLAHSLALSLGDERARRLLRQAGLRHRHLLVLSPYSVFPERAPRRPLPDYLHLLPVVQAADTIAMRGDGVARALPLDAFRRLLRTTWAIARNRA